MVAASQNFTTGRPRAGDPAAAERGLVRWARLPDPLAGVPPPARALDPERLLEAIFGNSPFLTEALLAEPHMLGGLLAKGPEQLAGELMDEVRALPLGNRNRVMAGLRQSRRRLALLVALADIGDLWPLERVTGTLSAFADLALQRALEQALLELAQRDEIELADPAHPQEDCGLIVLGMGKLGAFELNYSSDVDLIVLFDPERFRYRGREGPMACAVRLTRALVHLLEHRTKDGFVLRVDLRLRPHFPGHPLALPVDDAEQYYERHGQNWERAALIKARAVAGDRPAGERFLTWLEPFLWRRHLDYAAIRDIHSIKRQINAYRGHGTIRVAGHDIKVGRGGIREIEFFAQTQQLILGGRVPEIRCPATCSALEALAGQRWIEADAAHELIEAYAFLRRIEHRLQMVGDKQTHRLPEREDQLERFAAFAGFADGAALDGALRHHLERVETHYAALFESSIDLGGGHSLVFTGTEDDPDTLATLREMGFVRPQAVAGRVRGWHHGHIRATREARARELLTELMPRLLHALAEQSDPDAAFARFDEFVSSLPAGVQLFSLFRANPRLLMLVADIMGTAPRLAAHLSRHTGLFDAMLAPDFFEPLPDAAELAAELEAGFARARDLQDMLDAARRFAQGREYQIGLQVLLGLADGAVVGGALTSIAEVVIQALLPRVEGWLAEQHGRVPGGSFVVLGLGKLGSRELTLGSDLDLIFVYDADDRTLSDGPRPLAAPTYYARLSQRLISALTAQTPEGRLYEIDTRLRPSGNVGPVACSLANFARYQRESAQTWEHQALTRARVVAGDPGLVHKVDAAVEQALARPRDPDLLAREVGAMRERIFREYGDDDVWNLKHARGGLLEAEFLAQFLQLRFAPERPEVRATSAIECFERAAATGALTLAESALLIRAVPLYRRLQAVLRLSVSDRFVAPAAPPGLKEALVRAAAPGQGVHEGRLDFEGLQQELAASQAAVAGIFARFCPRPAEPPQTRDRRT